jgi:hypothetical protein
VQVAAPATTAVVTSLAGSATYFFAATALNSGGEESTYSNEATYSPTNLPPVANALSVSTLEDNPVSVKLSGSDPNGNPLTFAIQTPPLNGVLSGTAPNLVYTPRTNFFGSDQFSYIVSDGVASASAIVLITILPVNDPPTLNAPPGMIIKQNAGPQTVALSGITSGASNEAQPLTVTATSNNPNVIPNPLVTYTSPNATATLVYTPKTNAIGWSIISVNVQDGGASNNIVTQTFWVLINNSPTINPIANMTINEDAGTQTVALTGITSGAPNEVQPLKVTAVSSNPALIPNPAVTYTSPSTNGILTFAPVPNGFGTATITVTASDGQYGNNTTVQKFTVTVNAVNDPPTLNAITSLTVDSSAGARTSALSGISSGAANENQTLFVAAASSNPALVATPIVTYISPSSTATLTLTPALNQSGTATITVTVSDGQLSNNIISRSFVVTVVNPPKISGLSAGANDARTLNVSWNTDRIATCFVEYGPTAALGMVTGQTIGTNHFATLTNLQPATLYYLRVTATTSGGSATAVATASTEALQIVQWSAENGTLSGPVKIISSAGVENGKYVAASGKNSGTVTYNLNLLSGPTYRLWTRVKTVAGGGSFTISMDTNAANSVYVTDTAATNQWHWTLLANDIHGTNATLFPLEAGAHTTTAQIGPAVSFDEFVICNDPTWQPILATTRPALTATRTSTTTATLIWSDPSDTAVNVAIEYSTDGVNFAPFTTVSAATTSLAVGNLGAQPYYFRIYSSDGLDRTGFSNVAVTL